MANASAASKKMLFGTIVLLLLSGAATAADTSVGSRRDAPSVNTPSTDLPPASKIKRCNAVLANPQAFEIDLHELCKLLRSLTKPNRLRLPLVEFTKAMGFSGCGVVRVAGADGHAVQLALRKDSSRVLPCRNQVAVQSFPSSALSPA